MSINPNLNYSTIFINSLAEAGLRHVCIAPGSRSTPLTLAFHAHPDIECHLHLDERSAGFFALGLALATDLPVALVCTSGSAAANFFPAVIEAMMSQVPLLLLTADRPHELRHSGANQTIDQVKMFGDNVLWAVDAPLPTENAPAVALRNMHTLASRAYATANGFRKGPVQVNFPFRKPLEPRDRDEYSVFSGQYSVGQQSPTYPITQLPNYPTTQLQSGDIVPTPEQLEYLTAVIQTHRRGLIVCGPRCPAGGFPEAVAELSRKSGYPILADPTSGVRYGEWVKNTAVLSSYETFMQHPLALESPEVIIRFGAVPISKWLNDYLAKAEATHRIHIRQSGVWADDSHLVSYFLQVGETAVCREIVGRLGDWEIGGLGDWGLGIKQLDVTCRKNLDQVLAEVQFDGSCVADVVAALPNDALLFVGNSNPIRHLDQYGVATSKPIQAYASRGASGIDGNVSTALGMHIGSGKKLVMIVGDVTFYHDLNGLLMVKQLLDKQAEIDITIVLINNNGGGIFNRLPIAKFDPPFTEFFITPHGLDFEPVVRMYGLDFARVVWDENGRFHFQTHLQQSLNDKTPRVIEVQTNGQEDERIRREINQRMKAQMKDEG